MYLSNDVALSDFLLAAGLVVIGPEAFALLSRAVHLVTGSTVLANHWVILVVYVLIGIGFPRWLTRYRGDGLRGFALEGSPQLAAPGFVLALPVLVAYVATQWSTIGPIDAVLGRLAYLRASPTIGESSGTSVEGLVFTVAFVLLLFVGAAALWPFLAVRARHAFRSPDRSVTQALRTYGMTMAVVALVIGGLRGMFSDEARTVVALANVAALVVVILLADRMIGLAPTTTRATFVAPMIVMAFLVMRPSFVGAGSGLDAFNLYAGALTMGFLVVAIALIESRRTTWAALPLLFVGAWIPGCTGLLHWGLFAFNPGC